jgi:hypothetical protein
MSDMTGGSTKAVPRISVRLTPKLAGKLKREVSLRGQSESTVVRDALESYFNRKPANENCYDAAVRLGIIGCAKGLPRDLSTNKRYFKGFGD